MPTKKDPDARIYFYSHSDGLDIFHDLQRALQRNERWQDAEYLARIIFEEMTSHNRGGNKGFGISNEQHADVDHLIPVLNCETQEIEFDVPEDLKQHHPWNSRTYEPMTFRDLCECETFEDW